MTTVAKEQQHQYEVAIYQCRHESGLVSLRYWLLDRQAFVNRKWPHATDAEVKTYQGEARTLERLLKLIEQGPAIKEVQNRGDV